MAWWERAFELSAASSVSDQSHQHLVWTRGKEWLFRLLGMSEGPDNSIWQSQEEQLYNAIAQNYPFKSVSGCLGFSHGMTLPFCPGFPSCGAASQLVPFVLVLPWRCLFFPPSVFLLPSPGSPTPPSVPTTFPLSPVLEMWKCSVGGKELAGRQQAASGVSEAKDSLKLAQLPMTCLQAAPEAAVSVAFRSPGRGRQGSRQGSVTTTMFLIVPYTTPFDTNWLISASIFPSVKVV